MHEEALDLPAAVRISGANTLLGVAATFANDVALRKILFDAGICWFISTSSLGVSRARFRNLFEDIAYLLLRAMPSAKRAMGRTICTACCLFFFNFVLVLKVFFLQFAPIGKGVFRVFNICFESLGFLLSP